MKSTSLILLVCTIVSIASIQTCLGREKHKPKQNSSQYNKFQDDNDDNNDRNDTEKQSTGYQPNPIILAGVGQIMNGALNIAQDPHSRPNIGHSVANIIHGIMKIIIEKVAHKNITINNLEELENCFEEVYSEVTKKIIDIIDNENFPPQDTTAENT